MSDFTEFSMTTVALGVGSRNFSLFGQCLLFEPPQFSVDFHTVAGYVRRSKDTDLVRTFRSHAVAKLVESSSEQTPMQVESAYYGLGSQGCALWVNSQWQTLYKAIWRYIWSGNRS